MEQDIEDYYPFEFSATIDKLDYGRMAYHIVYLPESIQKKLAFGAGGRLRIEAEIGEYSWKGALSPAGDGRHYLLLSANCLKANRLSAGKAIEVHFRLDQADVVVLPVELERALEENPEAARVWDKLSAGHRRGLCYRVESGRRTLTRMNRMAEVLAFLRGQGHDPSKPAHKRKV